MQGRVFVAGELFGKVTEAVQEWLNGVAKVDASSGILQPIGVHP